MHIKKIASLLEVPESTIKKCIKDISMKMNTTEENVLSILNKHFSFKLLHKLPPEIREMIIMDLPVKDILTFCSSSKAFMELCKDDTLWKILLKRDYNLLPISYNPKQDYIFAAKVFSRVLNFEKNAKQYVLDGKPKANQYQLIDEIAMIYLKAFEFGEMQTLRWAMQRIGEIRVKQKVGNLQYRGELQYTIFGPLDKFLMILFRDGNTQTLQKLEHTNLFDKNPIKNSWILIDELIRLMTKQNLGKIKTKAFKKVTEWMIKHGNNHIISGLSEVFIIEKHWIKKKKSKGIKINKQLVENVKILSEVTAKKL